MSHTSVFPKLVGSKRTAGTRKADETDRISTQKYVQKKYSKKYNLILQNITKKLKIITN